MPHLTLTIEFRKRFCIDVNEGGKIKKHQKSDFIFSDVAQKFQVSAVRNTLFIGTSSTLFANSVSDTKKSGQNLVQHIYKYAHCTDTIFDNTRTKTYYTTIFSGSLLF